MGVAKWSEIVVGDIVEGSNYSMWSVESLNPTPNGLDVTLKNCSTGGVKGGHVKPDKPVTVLIPNSTVGEAAEALLQVHLGGEVVGRNEHGDWMTPEVFTHPGAILSHLYLFHGNLGNGKEGLRELTAVHHLMHSRGVGTKVPHVHDPDWLKGRSGNR